MVDSSKIIICTDGIFPFQVGGMQRHSRFLIEYLEKRKEIAELIVIHPHPDKIFNREKIVEIRTEPIHEEKNYLRECFLYSKRVAAILEKYPHHIIYSQGLCVWYQAKKYKNRLIVNPHGLEPFQALTFKDKLVSIPFKIIFKRIFNAAHTVVLLGGGLTKILRKNIDPEKICFLPNATESRQVGLQRKFLMAGEKVNCFFLSRFAENKGILILMQAITELNQDGYKDKFHFKLGGKGPLWDQYNSSVLSGNIELVGFIDDNVLGDYFLQCDLFVFPTLFEGMPTVILEAMSYSVPIISTDVGAVSELVSPKNGYLIAPNSVKELKESLLLFLNLDSESKEILSLNSKNILESRFTWDKVADSHIELFHEMGK